MNTVQPRERLLWLDQLRGIAMFFVVIGHVALPKSVNTYIYAFHMPIFFMISGMTHRANKYPTFSACVKDKAKKLLLPHVFMNIAMLPVWILNFKLLTNASPTLFELFKGIFFSNNLKYQTPSNATWFLVTLFVIEVLIYLFERVANNCKERVAIFVILCSIISYIESINKVKLPLFWHIDVAFTGIAFYYVGYLLMQQSKPITDKLNVKKWYYLLTILIFVVIGSYTSHLNGRISMTANIQRSFFYYYITAFTLSFAIILIVIKLPIMRLFSYIGRNTILYVGFHIPMIRFIENSYKYNGYTMGTWTAVAVGVFVYVCMSLVVAYVNNFTPFVVMKPFRENRKNYIAYCITGFTICAYIILTVLVTVKAFEWGRLSFF